jgi:hypothetical protein
LWLFLFPKITFKLEGRFYDIPTIQHNATSELDNLKVEDFHTMLPEVAETLGHLYIIEGGLL